MTPLLPDENKLTVGWLSEHVPLSWWGVMVTLMMGLFTTGYFVGSTLVQDLGTTSAKDLIRMQEEVDRLRQEIVQRQNERRSLEMSIVRLRVEKQVSEMSPEEIQEDLRKKWSRD